MVSVSFGLSKKKFFVFGQNFSVSDFRFSDFDKIGSTDSIELKRAALNLVFDSDSNDIRFIAIFKKKILSIGNVSRV